MRKVGKLSFSISYPYTLLRLTSVQGLRDYKVSSDLATITYNKFRAKVGCQEFNENQGLPSKKLYLSLKFWRNAKYHVSDFLRKIKISVFHFFRD